MQKKYYFVYLLTNKNHSVIYTGMTNNLLRRMVEHRSKLVPGFTKKYNVNKLVHYEIFETADSAITREKQIKAGSRAKKLELINTTNPEWRELFEDFEK